MLQYNKAMKKSIRASHCNNNNNVKEWKEFDEVINSLMEFLNTIITHLWIIFSWFSDKPKKQMNKEELAGTCSLSISLFSAQNNKLERMW